MRVFLDSVFPNADTKPLYDFESDEDTIVCVVTSLKDFKAQYLGEEAAIPVINFDESVLICGRVLMPQLPYYVKSMEITEDAKGSHLFIHTRNDNLTFQMFYHMYFWGLFPKKQYDIASVEIVKE